MRTVNEDPKRRDVQEEPPLAGYGHHGAEMQAGLMYAKACDAISDGQFEAFMGGIRERIGGGKRSNNRLWALVSLTAAALVLAFATFLIVSGERPSATATVVEQATSDIEGASVTWQSNRDGDVMVWVDVADGDVL